MFQFLLGSVRKYDIEVHILPHVHVKFLSLYNSAKIIKIDRGFPKVIITNALPPFYGSQCTFGGRGRLLLGHVGIHHKKVRQHLMKALSTTIYIRAVYKALRC